ncbi:OmpA family protein [Polaribacter sp. L3A8]|uniref:OmpA family protein n=1 Tax=Polaribacter sp. L3A8 TaxID=2686361 RepID=UPI00131B908D|nr:OmpA family protein [Polaribacter sp. L3A8]
MNSIKYISISFLLLGSLTMSYGQQKDVNDTQESIVVMSEADILSLTQKFRLYKKEKSLKKNSKITLVKQNDSIFTKQNNSSFDFDYLKSRIEELENRLNNQNNSAQKNNTFSSESNEFKNLKLEISELRHALLQKQSNNVKSNVVYLPFINRNVEEPEQITEDQAANNSIIVQQKQDSIYKEGHHLNQPNKAISVSDLEALEFKIQELKNEISQNKTLPSNYEKLIAKYKNYKKEIYFANNSKVLNDNSLQTVEDLYAILEVNENLDIIVKGFASNKGNAIYNENLSMLRTEGVKKALMLRGVHATRVLTQYHGIDYSAQSDSQARRVEVSFLVRK